MSEENKEMLENPEMKSEEIPEEEIDQAAGGLLGKNMTYADSFRKEMGLSTREERELKAPKNFIG